MLLRAKRSLKKCKRGTRVKFGGFIVNTEEDELEIDVNKDKPKKIRNFPKPGNKDDVASFIGLIKTLNNWSGAVSLKMEKIYF